MILLSQEQLDTPVAELERWGLEVRVAGTLERCFNVIYIKDLIGFTAEDLTETEVYFGVDMIDNLKTSLRMWYDGK